MARADAVYNPGSINTSATKPTAGLDWLDVKDDASPTDIFRAIGRLAEKHAKR